MSRLGRNLVSAISLGLLFGLTESIFAFLTREDSLSRWWSASFIDAAAFSVVAVLLFAAAKVLRRDFSAPATVAVLVFAGSIFDIYLILSEFTAWRYAISIPAGLLMGFACWRWPKRFETTLRNAGFVALIAALAINGWLGMAEWRRARTFAERVQSHPAHGPNFLVIVVDTLRADHVHAYGYPKSITPAMDALAARGIRFDQAIATTSWTLPSHASLLTGLLPSENGVTGEDKFSVRLDPSFRTLPQEMALRGYHTGAVSANQFLFSRDRGFGTGFADFEDESFAALLTKTALGARMLRYASNFRLIDDLPGRWHAEDVNRIALHWIDARRDAPFFLFLNYFDVHDPYQPPHAKKRLPLKYSQTFGKVGRLDAAEVRELEEYYDACIEYTDAQIGELMAALKQRQLDGNTIVILLSDHGESFDEHGFLAHANALYYELIRVPMVVVGPGVPAGKSVSTPVSLASLPSTVVDLAGGGPESFPEPSLKPLWEQPPAVWPYPISELARIPTDPTFPNYNSSLESIVTPQWHLITGDKSVELFPCCSTDLERVNQAAESPGQVAALRKAMEEGGQIEAVPVAGSPGNSGSAQKSARRTALPKKKPTNEELLHSLGYVK